METAIGRTLDSAARAVAQEKLLENELARRRALVSRSMEQAQTAVARQDDPAARAALGRKRDHETLVAALEDRQASARSASARLRRQLDAMRVRLSEARHQQALLVARQHCAEDRRKFATDRNSENSDESFARFDRLRRRVEQAEAESEALCELCGSADVSFEHDAFDREIEAELQSMKQGLHQAGSI
jgi:phage shock protein A